MEKNNKLSNEDESELKICREKNIYTQTQTYDCSTFLQDWYIGHLRLEKEKENPNVPSFSSLMWSNEMW